MNNTNTRCAELRALEIERMTTAGAHASELLAPAGAPECAYAAFRYGADAVYCGLRQGSARAEAVNFSVDELRELCAYARALPRPRRVFVALNVLTHTAELADTAEALVSIDDAGADAVIIQDLGVLQLATTLTPRLERHASTQLAVHSLAGARMAMKLGFAQVTLARELSFDEVREICDAGIPTEVFIHGALCYSYSGLCLLSSLKYGRSGNRGRCAYPCRDLFSIEPEAAPSRRPDAARPHSEALAFSMKDLCLAESVTELSRAGVRCLKIEGRMKGALYVAAVTDFYRKLLDGALRQPGDIAAAKNDIRTVFSRSWTQLYTRSPSDPRVTDPLQTGNRGLQIGTVQSVTRAHGGHRVLAFRTARALELHDGLQFEPSSGTDIRPYGFAIKRFLPNAARGAASAHPIFSVPAGASVRLALPDDAPAISAGAPLYCTSSQAVRRRFDLSIPPILERKQRIPVDVVVLAEPHALTVTATIVDPFRSVDTPSPSASVSLPGSFAPARDPARSDAAILEAFSRIGDTGFALRRIDARPPHSIEAPRLFFPISLLNGIRRELFDQLATARNDALASRLAAARREAACFAPAPGAAPRMPAPEPLASERWTLMTDQPSCLARIPAQSIDELQLPLDVDPPRGFPADTVRFALPTIVRTLEEDAVRTWISRRIESGYSRFSAANLASFDLLSHSGVKLDIHADWPLYTVNPQTVKLWRDLGLSGYTLSPEETDETLAALVSSSTASIPTPGVTALLYQDTPLMISETCPRAALSERCEHCAPEARRSTLRFARNGSVLHVIATTPGTDSPRTRVPWRRCRQVIVSDRPFCRADRLATLRRLGVRSYRVDLAYRDYDAAAAAMIWNAVRAGRCPGDT